MSGFDIVRDFDDMRVGGHSQNGTSALRLQRKTHDPERAGSSPLASKFNTPGKSLSTYISPARGGSNAEAAGNIAKNGKNLKTPTRGDNNPEAAGNLAKSGKKSKTPTRKTPSRQADRFIPNRANANLDYGHFALMNAENQEPKGEGETADQEYSNQLEGARNNCDNKILNFKMKAPEAARSDGNNQRVLYNVGKYSSKAPSASTRYIPSQPERILDAPDLIDDYYLNLLDWSPNNILSVALGITVYLWNADTSTIDELFELSTPGDYISAVSWVQEGAILAVGLSTGAVQLWDTEEKKLLRTMTGHAARVGCLSWNKHILSSGSKSGAIHHHDVRVAQHHVATLQNHSQEICGLQWSPNGRYLASGGNDNLVNIWTNQMGAPNTSTPVHTFSQHRAAVKAIAWCPWQPNLLATGGGSADRQILMWNIHSGANVGTTATDSQVCALLWSKEHKELVSAHGYATNHLRLWKYPTMTKVTDLVGHSARILCMTMSPDGTTVASAAGDETIRLWECFRVDKAVKKTSGPARKADKNMVSGLAKCIR